MGTNYWQIGGGNGRTVVEYYKNAGVACIGPGIKVENTDWESLKKMCESAREAGALWYFVKEVNPGDYIFVKNGRKGIALIGRVKDAGGKKDYKLLEGFDGVYDGWDLQHRIEMDWFEVVSDDVWNRLFKNDYSFPVIRFSQCANGMREEVKTDEEIIKGILENTALVLKTTPNPNAVRNFKYQIPGAYAFDAEQLRLNQSKLDSCLTETFRKIFLVVPFLKKLGWIPEMMEFEKHTTAGNIDLVLYEDLLHKKPFAIIETKKAGSSIGSWALKQVLAYEKIFPQNEKPKLIIVTNGSRYLCKVISLDEYFEIDLGGNMMTGENCLNYLHPATFPDE